MTATPIPRTLTMTVYGDLDVSVIDELPPGRKPIETHWKQIGEREEVYQALRDADGPGQAGVCRLSADRGVARSCRCGPRRTWPSSCEPRCSRTCKVGLLHGQMKTDDKDAVMTAFRAGEMHMLVSTTVIEVGVDVANATVMVVEDADRFGLAQLASARGRVGRGERTELLRVDLRGQQRRTRSSECR